MHPFVRIPLVFLIIAGVAACTPVETPTQPGSTALPTSGPAPTLRLDPLESPEVETGLETLLQMQAARNGRDVSLILGWNSQPVIAWNEQARYWVSYYGMDPVVASRVYALTSVAQQRALDSLARVNDEYSDRKPELLSDQIKPVAIPVDPFESAMLIGATEPIFLLLFAETPKEIGAVFAEARNSLLASGTILPGDVKVAEAFGGEIAQTLIEERSDDGASAAREFDPQPAGEGIWKLDPFRVKPEQPGWGKVTPWLMTSPDQFRAPAPPEFGSPAFQTALEEVRLQQQNNTQAQLGIAQEWADKRFTSTPPGHWNSIAVDLIRRYALSEREAAHVLSSLNMAVMDSGIACWDSKYHYLVIRPWQADPNIAGLVGYPNHPSYPSGHSCFSGASAETLSYFFPAERGSLWQMAEEASISRFYGGIHYLFDLEAGKEMGRQIGGLAQEYANDQNWTSFTP
jgi:membrane-associated phospholipid phosphatase